MTTASFDLYWIVVDTRVQRRGVGKQLLRRVEQEVVRRGRRRLYIDTSSSGAYEGTRAFYRSNGYRVVTRLDDFYREGEAKLIFCRNLCDPTH